jgi:uncharacterized protein YbcC (UPF0753/DUF2309 family)
MLHDSSSNGASADAILAQVDKACRAIPPVWPLASSVAVNPFLGQSGETLPQAAARLERVAGTRITMPRDWYRSLLGAGTILDEDIDAAINAQPADGWTFTVEQLRSLTTSIAQPPAAPPTVAELAGAVSDIDWPGLIAERIGSWAAGYFDEGQALWAAPSRREAYPAWRMVAMHDLTPEIIGLPGFAVHVSETPDNSRQAIVRACTRLGLQTEALETYLHQVLLSLGGWAQYARYLLWQAELDGGTDTTLVDLLAIRMTWEEALWEEYKGKIATGWQASIHAHAAPVVATSEHLADAILQDAFERAAQRRLGDVLAAPAAMAQAGRPPLQVAFCIDVRSEVFRRALESVNPQIQTLGFAGFFGIAVSHRRLASDVAEHRLPVLLSPKLESISGGEAERPMDQRLRIKARAKRAWGRFRLAAVSSFAFVEATGPVYATKLVTDTLGLSKKPAAAEPAPQFQSQFDVATRVSMAASLLGAMSLRSNFGRLVVLAGHGASVVNNPHASSLNCGACGGYAGDVNARLFAGLLNDPKVREGLIADGIAIPHDTLFVAALHNTTTDAVTLYPDDLPSPGHAEDLRAASLWLKSAGALARAERALRLPGATDKNIPNRSRDWAEVQPEWALAGCSAFIAAPRRFTVGKNLEGRAFLHDYDWQADKGFGVLELILTAPVVVASWISLQYYGSTVAPALFGSGNKLLHNVVGGIGIIEGNGGLLRAGLPQQSVFKGDQMMHEPLRLSVCLAAPTEAISNVLKAHPNVRELFDNRWLHLFALDETGRMAWRYKGDLDWLAIRQGAQPQGIAA